MEPLEQAIYYCLKLFLSLVVLATVLYFMCQATHYKRIFGKEGDGYIMATFLLLALAQFMFGAYETCWAVYYVILYTNQSDSSWGAAIMQFYYTHIDLILKACDFCQIFGYAFQTTAFLINIKRWETLLLTASLSELNSKLEKEAEAAFFDTSKFDGKAP